MATSSRSLSNPDAMEVSGGDDDESEIEVEVGAEAGRCRRLPLVRVAGGLPYSGERLRRAYPVNVNVSAVDGNEPDFAMDSIQTCFRDFRLTDSSPRERMPMPIDLCFYGYQLAEIHRCCHIENKPQYLGKYRMCTRVGVLCNPPGSGKNHVILGLVARNRISDTSRLGVFVTSNSYFSAISPVVNFVPATVVVAPWQFMGSWSSLLRSVDRLTFFEIKRVRSMANVYCDVILVPDKLFARFAESNVGVTFHRLVFDNVQCLSNFSATVRNLFTWVVEPCVRNIEYLELKSRNHLIASIYERMRELPFAMPFLAVVSTREEIVARECWKHREVTTVHFSMASSSFSALSSGDRFFLGLHNKSMDVIRSVMPASNVGALEDLIPRIIFPVEYSVAVRGATPALVERRKYLVESIAQDTDCVICMDTDVRPRLIVGCCRKSMCTPCAFTWLIARSTCPCCKADVWLDNAFVVCEAPFRGRLCRDTPSIIVRQILERTLMVDPSRRLFITNENYDVMSMIRVARMLRDLGQEVHVIDSDCTHKGARAIVQKRPAVIVSANRKKGLHLELDFVTDLIIFDRLPNDYTVLFSMVKRGSRERDLAVWCVS
ncbi:ORF057 [Saltwater crocodilepox virus]|nr:ORF057 [Saltwater crocodilepox virus]